MSDFFKIAGGAIEGLGMIQGARDDVKELEAQARTVGLQTNRDEEAQRRMARQVIGAQAAASTGNNRDEGLLRQSMVDAELDALNIRYAGHLKRRSLLGEGRAIAKQTPYLAGAKLLTAAGQGYTRSRSLTV